MPMIGGLNVAVLLLLAGADGSAPAGFDFSSAPEADLERRVGSPGTPGSAAREDSDQDPEEPGGRRAVSPPSPGAPSSTSQSLLDLGWVELYPRAGIAEFSSKYHINASPCLEIEGRAPIPWLSPASNPEGDYFGAFAQLNLAMIKRTIQPKLAKPSGIMASLALGLDYTLYRDSTWLWMARLGFDYTNYGGVTDLKSGGQALAGMTGGVSLSRSLLLTVTPEILYAKTGDYILMGLLGIAIEF
jgi:hypothetical protein